MISLSLCQVNVQVPCHQKFSTPGVLLERCNNTLYRQGVVVGKVTLEYVSSPLPHIQLEANNVGPKLMDGLHRITR